MRQDSGHGAGTRGLVCHLSSNRLADGPEWNIEFQSLATGEGKKGPTQQLPGTIKRICSVNSHEEIKQNSSLKGSALVAIIICGPFALN